MDTDSLWYAVVPCQSQSQSSAAVTMQTNEWHGIGTGIPLAGVDTLIYVWDELECNILGRHWNRVDAVGNVRNNVNQREAEVLKYNWHFAFQEVLASSTNNFQKDCYHLSMTILFLVFFCFGHT